MTRISRSALLEVPTSLAYQVVVDVDRYPDFLPGCDRVDVLERTDTGLTARVSVSGMGMQQTFVTRNQHSADTITMSLEEGPLQSLEGVWQFAAIGDLGCRVEIDIEFEADGLLGRLFSPIAEKVTNKLVDAFVLRMERVAEGET